MWTCFEEGHTIDVVKRSRLASDIKGREVIEVGGQRPNHGCVESVKYRQCMSSITKDLENAPTPDDLRTRSRRRPEATRPELSHHHCHPLPAHDVPKHPKEIGK